MAGFWDAVQPKLDIYGAIKGFEGYTPKASWDYKQHSIGYGTRAKYPGEVIDRNEAENRLRSEVDNARRIVDGFAPNAPEGVKHALTSLTFNAGSKWTESGLGQAVKAGDWNTAKNRFVQYNKAGGAVLPGLVARRQQEAQWFDGNHVAAAPAVASTAPFPNRMSLGGPMPAPKQQKVPGGAPDFFGDIGARMQNPLFLGGLGMLVAANQGQDAATALNAGMRTGAMMQDQQSQTAERQRELMRQKALEDFWNSYDPSQLPPAVASVLPGLSPSQRAELVLQSATGQLPTREDADFKREASRANLALTQAQTEALKRKQEPDPIDLFILNRLRGGQASPMTQPQAPMLQPQSFQGQPQLSPGIQLIADDSPALATPQPQQEMVETPYGRMPREEAQSLAGSMLLSPKYSAAGRAILDSLSRGSDVGMSKPAANQLDERTISAASTLGRLQEIKKQFKPEFLQIPNRLRMFGAQWGSKLGGKVNPEMQKALQEYAAFRATAFDNFNQLLKEMSGTAVSAQELSRQQLVQPNPGEGLFDGDDPQTFMGKIEQGEKIYRAAMARMNFLRNQGLNFNKETAEQFMRLEDVPATIDRRGAEIEQQLKQRNPKADPMAIERETKRLLKQEFGI